MSPSNIHTDAQTNTRERRRRVLRVSPRTGQHPVKQHQSDSDDTLRLPYEAALNLVSRLYHKLHRSPPSPLPSKLSSKPVCPPPFPCVPLRAVPVPSLSPHSLTHLSGSLARTSIARSSQTFTHSTSKQTITINTTYTHTQLTFESHR